MNKPIAVITVTYSPGDHLAAFISSLATATQRGVEIYLADNGSTDGVPQQHAHSQDNVHFLPTGGNIGYGSAINYAVASLAQAREQGRIDADFFVLANPDVTFEPGSIDAMIQCARRWEEKGYRVGDVGPYIRQSDGSAYPSARAVPTVINGIGHALFGAIWKNNPWSKSYRDNAVMDQERSAGWLSGSCLVVNWSAFDEIGGFDQRYFMYMEDVDLGDRFGRAGMVNVFCPSAVITHAVGHAAGKNPEKMLPAHHDSAYRFQADRHPYWWQAPLRWALWCGLKVRAYVAVVIAQKRGNR
ncbi:glycosyltransferase family 2 protein [Corynebacterium kutscheri]|uniref:dTDP-Rha:alpha-D-GlcNAc-pyrophosphate polyprenol, alpha-3-L-rhamnosyltransferase n=1 Tax=Corynebacterium kutscheri TaxID=35755 RepID=A0AB38VPG6_9CORY|nr:glycosyltransferase family 2 protein [Corynebacterium kutscheri]VEH04686.1 dTDP-Rha:alpha-D-GlcNAc-pyrophosphate polyprenol, alpha-3-L-rhamnosyltransferase [Corynebacterium kutscheri]